MLGNGVVNGKIRVIYETVSELRNLSDLTVERLEGDFFLRRGVERSLQICVEAVIDIAHRLVSLFGAPPCSTATAALETLEQKGVIQSSQAYRKMVQFRNVIVHRYENVDTAILVDVVLHRLGDFECFVQEVSDAHVEF